MEPVARAPAGHSRRLPQISPSAWKRSPGQPEALRRRLAEYAHFGTIADRASTSTSRWCSLLGRGVATPAGRSSSVRRISATRISAATARRLGLPLTVVYSRQANPTPSGWCNGGADDPRLSPLDDSLWPSPNELSYWPPDRPSVDLRVESGRSCRSWPRSTLRRWCWRDRACPGCPLIPVVGSSAPAGASAGHAGRSRAAGCCRIATPRRVR